MSVELVRVCEIYTCTTVSVLYMYLMLHLCSFFTVRTVVVLYEMEGASRFFGCPARCYFNLACKSNTIIINNININIIINGFAAVAWLI
ncbi:hypothetical protein BCV70DRAFT_18305 [Testicularia cyperi]|uniref:Uncharacterized protein n=1 Tax=Testicularia cyperi TaxID=1882483 RepID=A0A317Y1P9_9BASI|nr:hypothetical protein BCV70DRAFT_18305 [Testicularia cyperi]